MGSELVEIEPSVLMFHFDPGKHMPCFIQLTNKSDNCVGFKVKTKAPKKFCVKPNIGVIEAKGTTYVKVTMWSMQAQRMAAPDLLCKDKFLIQSTIVPFGLTKEKITPEMFVKDPIKHIEEKKLKVILVEFPVSIMPSNGLSKQDFLSDASLQSLLQSGLVEIQPPILKFTSELRKQTSCLIQLTNKTENFVGFKVKTTNPKKYCVRPNKGVIKAKAAAEVRVTMQAQSVAPPDLLCKDKFLIQSTIAPFGSIEENIMSEMFVKGPNKHIEEKKLMVVFTPPTSNIAEPSNGIILKQDLLSDASLQKDEEAPTKKETTQLHVLGMMKKPLSWLLLTIRRHSSSSFAHYDGPSSPESLTVPLLNNMVMADS